jgi:hypothetical protein
VEPMAAPTAEPMVEVTAVPMEEPMGERQNGASKF